MTQASGIAQAPTGMLQKVRQAVIWRSGSQIVAQEAFGRDGPYAIASQLNEAIAVGDWTLFTTFLDRIERVTPEAVQDVARRTFVRDTMTVGVFDPILPETA